MGQSHANFLASVFEWQDIGGAPFEKRQVPVDERFNKQDPPFLPYALKVAFGLGSVDNDFAMASRRAGCPLAWHGSSVTRLKTGELIVKDGEFKLRKRYLRRCRPRAPGSEWIGSPCRHERS